MTETRSKLMLIGFVWIVVLSASAFGQIRIPGILKPKQDPTVQTTSPQNPTAQKPTSNGSNSQPGSDLRSTGNYVDDGFTWFESVSTDQLDEKQHTIYTGWALKSSIRMVGDFPQHSAFKMVVSRAGKTIGTTLCDARVSPKVPGSLGVAYLAIDGCYNRDSATKELGKFDVDVILIDGAGGAERSVRKYTIEVLKVDRVSGPVANPQPDPPRYYISRHAEAPVSFMFLRPGGVQSYIPTGQTSRKFDVEIYFSLSPSDAGKVMGILNIGCSVDGRPLEMDPGSQGNISALQMARSYEEIYSDRLAPAYKTGPAYKDDIGFRLIRVPLPFVWKDGNGRLTMSEHPGNWECNMVKNEEIVRTWRWTVGRDGMPVKHPEQNGNIDLFFNSYLLDTTIPAGGSSLDKRLASTSLVDGFFYGQKWTTAAGKAMAAKVPVKGSSIPTPSNKIK